METETNDIRTKFGVTVYNPTKEVCVKDGPQTQAEWRIILRMNLTEYQTKVFDFWLQDLIGLLVMMEKAKEEKDAMRVLEIQDGMSRLANYLFYCDGNKPPVCMVALLKEKELHVLRGFPREGRNYDQSRFTIGIPNCWQKAEALLVFEDDEEFTTWAIAHGAEQKKDEKVA